MELKFLFVLGGRIPLFQNVIPSNVLSNVLGNEDIMSDASNF